MEKDNWAAINIFVSKCNQATMAWIAFLKREESIEARAFLEVCQDLEEILDAAKERARDQLPAGDSMQKDDHK